MPGCAAVGCNNRSEKGYIMKCFPRDPKLRKIWQDRVARADWVPSNNSFLCHVHFKADEWCIADNGRVKLKKDAIPSIFTVTSTRKSPKKRKKLKDTDNMNECESECISTCLDNDTEYSSTGHAEEKDSDSSVRSFIHHLANHKKVIGNKITSYKHKENRRDHQQENIILISDDNMEMQDTNKKHDNGKTNVENEKSTTDFPQKENPTDNSNNVIKTEIKREIDQTLLNENYDEIEEKLKQICDGYREESKLNSAEKPNAVSRNQREIWKPLHKSINYRYSSRNEISNMLTSDTNNIEIIFGTESGEEYTRISKCTSYNNDTNEIDKLSQHTINIDNINDKSFDKTSSEDMEETFDKESMQNISNMRAAMKRKRRTRDEIMKSIKKSIHNASSHDIDSINNSDISDNIMEAENEIEKKSNTSENIKYNDCVSTASVTRYTVKVTGNPDDVFDIMQDLFKDTKDINIQEYDDTSANKENNAFVTSVITIDYSDGECNGDNDILSTNDKNISKDNDQILPCLSSQSTNDQYTSPTSRTDKKLNNSHSCYLTPTINVTQQSTNDSTFKCEYEKLSQKVKTQENVITKLTDQLILCKGIEKHLRNQYSLLEKKFEKLIYECNIKTDDASFFKKTEKMDSRQKLIDELSSRLNYFEEANKKLVKNITVESEQRKKFESQIKQRDKRIKELNWKLEKASKYLERAERNTNTYRKKMLNMQTFIRRRKLLDEKLNRFNEILIECVKQSYFGKTLPMDIVMEIKKTCGTSGYDKLLSHGFPLPALAAIRTLPNDNLSDFNESNDILRTIPLKDKANEKYDIQCTKHEIEVDTKDSEIVGSVSKEIALDGTETITGTVQDIFEENNDGDDFSTNELTEHFISQLHTTI